MGGTGQSGLGLTSEEERMMGKRSHFCTAFAFAGLLCLGVASAAIGCGFHSALEVQLD